MFLRDVGGFLVRLARVDLHGLHERRVDPAHHHGTDHEQAEPDRGSQPVLREDRGEEQHRADDRDDEQRELGRQQRVHVRVRRPAVAVGGAALDHECVPVEPVGGRLEQHEEPEQRRDVSARRCGGLLPRRLQAQAAVEVVGHQRGQQRHDHHREAEADQETPEGQPEGEERDVDAELGVLAAERLGVAPQQERLPLARGRPAGEQAEDGGPGDRDDATVGIERDAVAVKALLLHGQAAEHGSKAVGDPDVAADDRTHREPEQHEEQDPGLQLGRVDGREPDRAEPQQVGVEAGEHPEGHDDGPEHQQGEQQRSAPGPPGDGSSCAARLIRIRGKVEAHRANVPTLPESLRART